MERIWVIVCEEKGKDLRKHGSNDASPSNDGAFYVGRRFIERWSAKIFHSKNVLLQIADFSDKSHSDQEQTDNTCSEASILFRYGALSLSYWTRIKWDILVSLRNNSHQSSTVCCSSATSSIVVLYHNILQGENLAGAKTDHLADHATGSPRPICPLDQEMQWGYSMLAFSNMDHCSKSKRPSIHVRMEKCLLY